LDAVYQRHDDTFEPTELAASPWSADTQHGGPPAALLAEAIAGVDQTDMAVVRVTVEMLTPVPMRPLRVSARITRAGKRLQLAEAVLLDGDQIIARALGMRIRRRSPLDLPTIATDLGPVPPAPDNGHDTPFEGLGGFYQDALDHRYLVGALTDWGPATAWLRMKVPLVEGEAITPLQRVMTAADCGNGVSMTFDPRQGLFINPDLTVYLHRYPEGEWILLDAITRLDPSGLGMAESALSDQNGRIGRSVQGLFVERAPDTQ
jgi:hypothetical protein